MPPFGPCVFDRVLSLSETDFHVVVASECSGLCHSASRLLFIWSSSRTRPTLRRADPLGRSLCPDCGPTSETHQLHPRLLSDFPFPPRSIAFFSERKKPFSLDCFCFFYWSRFRATSKTYPPIEAATGFSSKRGARRRPNPSVPRCSVLQVRFSSGILNLRFILKTKQTAI